MLKNFTLILCFSLLVYNYKSDVKLKSKTELKTIHVDTTLLFGIWGIQEGGDAAFRITNQDFYVVDFFETSIYSLEKNKLIIHKNSHNSFGNSFFNCN